jgi:phage FluMu protein Com
MEEIRCPICNRLLMRGRIVYVEIKCPKCNNVIRLYGEARIQEIKMSIRKQ